MICETCLTSYWGDPSLSTESEWVALLHSPPWTSPPADRCIISQQEHVDTNEAEKNKTSKNLPWENLWAEFQSCPQTLPESALDRICQGRLDWPTPAAPFPVMHTNKHASRNTGCCLTLWDLHLLRVRWEDQYHDCVWSLNVNLEPGLLRFYSRSHCHWPRKSQAHIPL